VALPAFARRTPLLLSANRSATDRYRGKPAAAGLLPWAHAETDISVP